MSSARMSAKMRGTMYTHKRIESFCQDRRVEQLSLNPSEKQNKNVLKKKGI